MARRWHPDRTPIARRWHADGTPMSAAQFMETLFGKLPEFFQDEAELRTLWSAPETRARLLEGLAEKGFGHDQRAEMQRMIDAEKSDLFDVLAYVAYLLPPRPAKSARRRRRWRSARSSIHGSRSSSTSCPRTM